MKLHYMKEYSGNEDDITCTYHREGSVPFKEIQNMKKLALFLNSVSTVLSIIFLVLVVIRQDIPRDLLHNPGFFLGCLASIFVLFPHELLHAVCFKEDVYLYTNFKQGMLFVVGPEDISKGRFILMSMLPNLVFGFVPFIVYMIWPELTFLGSFGALSMAMGVGDYYNVINAVFQMPKGARTYLYKTHSYWYMPEEEETENEE